MMTPLNRPSTRSFDVDRYLDRQLNQGQPQNKRIERAIQQHGVPERIYCDNGKDYLRVRRRGFRAWALRLNNQIEIWMDCTDWKAFELKAEKVCACVFTGVVVYFLFVVADAWLQGHFNLGGR